MKVYELIAQLSEMPAGAEVKVRTLKTLAEFVDNPIADIENGAELYRLNLNTVELVEESSELVIIYD